MSLVIQLLLFLWLLRRLRKAIVLAFRVGRFGGFEAHGSSFNGVLTLHVGLVNAMCDKSLYIAG